MRFQLSLLYQIIRYLWKKTFSNKNKRKTYFCGHFAIAIKNFLVYFLLSIIIIWLPPCLKFAVNMVFQKFSIKFNQYLYQLSLGLPTNKLNGKFIGLKTKNAAQLWPFSKSFSNIFCYLTLLPKKYSDLKLIINSTVRTNFLLLIYKSLP